MAVFKVRKVISALPDPLEASCLYFVRTGAGFDLYLSNSVGTLAHKINDLEGTGGCECFPDGTTTFNWSGDDLTSVVFPDLVSVSLVQDAGLLSSVVIAMGNTTRTLTFTWVDDKPVSIVTSTVTTP